MIFSEALAFFNARGSAQHLCCTFLFNVRQARLEETKMKSRYQKHPNDIACIAEPAHTNVRNKAQKMQNLSPENARCLLEDCLFKG